MQIVPWRRRRELDLFRDEFDKMLERFFGELSPFDIFEGRGVPAIDLSETDDEYIVKAEVPGIEPKDVEVSIVDGVLTIKGQKKREEEKKKENYHRVERSYGEFSRSIRIPSPVQEDKIEAKYKNGVLRIVLPKVEEAKKKTIEVKVE